MVNKDEYIKIRNPYISVVYIFSEVKFKFKCLQLN